MIARSYNFQASEMKFTPHWLDAPEQTSSGAEESFSFLQLHILELTTCHC